MLKIIRDGEIMKRYFIDFKNDHYGIDLVCKNEDEARKIVKNPRS